VQYNAHDYGDKQTDEKEEERVKEKKT